MKSIKTILSVIVIAIASVANADTLYWMTESYGGPYVTGDYASLYAVANGSTTFVEGAGYLPSYGYIVGATDVSNYADSDTSFYITISHKTGEDTFDEVYNGSVVNMMSYQDLVDGGYIRTATSEENADKMWDAAAVPEPTGGALLLLGAALLGLRRKVRG